MPCALRNSSIARAGGSRILSLRERTNHLPHHGKTDDIECHQSAFLKFGSHRMRENERNSYPYNDRLLDVHVEARRMAGVLFFDEAYYLHRPDNERDYGQEAIEILLAPIRTKDGWRDGGVRELFSF